MRSRSTASLAASPVLVGAVTVLVTIVAVFLSYNANTGLPFVPTYDLKANLPNGAQLVKGFEVRIGGARVGQVSKIEAKRRSNGTAYAQITMKLDKQIEPLKADTTLLVRPRSAVGLKYVQLTPGRGEDDLESGAVIPVRQARPPVVELDDFFNMFDDKARVGSRNSLNGYGGGLAGRGADLNSAIGGARPAAGGPRAGRREPGLAPDPARALLQGARRRRRRGGAGGREQAALFVNLDTTFTALASIARPYLQETISEGPPSEELAIRDFPFQRPVPRATTPPSSTSSSPASRRCRTRRRSWRTRSPPAPRRCPRRRRSTRSWPTSSRPLADFSEDPLVRGGVNQLTRLSSSLKPTLAFLTPVQTTCNYATLFFRNASSVLSDGDSNGTWQRFIILPSPSDVNGAIGPNNEIGPASAPANGPLEDNHLHTNPYPNTASPGQTRECEAGNEHYSETSGQDDHRQPAW